MQFKTWLVFRLCHQQSTKTLNLNLCLSFYTSSGATNRTHHQCAETCAVWSVRDKGGDVLTDLSSVCRCQVARRLDVNRSRIFFLSLFFWISLSFIRHIYPSRNALIGVLSRCCFRLMWCHEAVHKTRTYTQEGGGGVNSVNYILDSRSFDLAHINW